MLLAIQIQIYVLHVFNPDIIHLVVNIFQKKIKFKKFISKVLAMIILLMMEFMMNVKIAILLAKFVKLRQIIVLVVEEIDNYKQIIHVYV